MSFDFNLCKANSVNNLQLYIFIRDGNREAKVMNCSCTLNSI